MTPTTARPAPPLALRTPLLQLQEDAWAERAEAAMEVPRAMLHPGWRGGSHLIIPDRQPVELPNAGQAEVSSDKVTLYLLSLSHPEGGSKARFFLSKGYSARRPQRLMWDLRRLAQEGRVTQVVPSEHGTKYLVEGELEGPRGGSFRLRSLWIIRAEEEHPRFVTAYPVTLGS